MSQRFEYDLTRDPEMKLLPSPQLLAASKQFNEHIVTVEVTEADSKDRFVMFLALFAALPRVGDVITLEREELAIVTNVLFVIERPEIDGRKITRYAPYVVCKYKDEA